MKLNSTYLAKSAEILSNALLGEIWIQAADKYLATDLDGTSRLCPLWIDDLVLECVCRLRESLSMCTTKCQLLTTLVNSFG